MIMAMRAAVSTLDCRASRHSHSYCFPEFLYEVSNSAMMILLCQPLCSVSLPSSTTASLSCRHLAPFDGRPACSTRSTPSSPLCGDARSSTP